MDIITDCIKYTAQNNHIVSPVIIQEIRKPHHILGHVDQIH